jgi:hypothetical protein
VDLLTQAKQFISKKASKLAMAAVPLAVLAVAVPAKATVVVLDSGADNCFAENPGSCVLTTSPTGGNTFMNQVTLTGTATTSGGFASLGNSGSGTSNGGLLSGNVPVFWDFTITGNSGPVGWSVFFDLNYSGGDDFFSLSGSTAGGEVTGSGSISVPTAINVISYGIGISANGSGSFTLSAPLVLNSTQSSAPEPGSLLLMGAGGAALLIGRRKKRTRTRASAPQLQ